MRSFLFIAAMPPPTTGQSLACDLLLRSMDVNAKINLINLSKKTFRQGVSSVGRVKEVFFILQRVFFNRFSSDVIYFTISESISGNLKDLLIYLVCWSRLNRMVIHLHGGAGMRDIMSDKHPLLRAMNNFFLRKVGGVIVLGERLKFIYEGVVLPSKLHVVPNFAMDEFFISPHDIHNKYAHLNSLNLLFLSNLLPGKGHLELLAALGQLPPDLQARLQVDFAGGFQSVEEEAQFHRQIEQTRNVRVTVHGVVHGEKKRELLRQAHLFCLPTYYPYEGQPISILEAYASGCAVMTTDHSGIFDTFTPGINGIEVKPRSHESIRQALLFALTHEKDLHDYARNNLQYAHDKYRASIHIKAMQDVFETIK